MRETLFLYLNPVNPAFFQKMPDISCAEARILRRLKTGGWSSPWFITENKATQGMRDRRGGILFIDARKMGHMVDWTHREVSDEDIKKIADTYILTLL